MIIEARQTLVWGTAAGAVISAALLASSGSGPRGAGLGSDAARARPVAAVRVEARGSAPPVRDGASAAPGPADH